MTGNNDTHLSRHAARVKAMQVLYAYEISHEPIEMLIESIAGEARDRNEESFQFSQNLIYSVLRHREEADALLDEMIRNWDLQRIAIIDKVILRIGICEFLYFSDIPTKVTMNECVEIGKKYSTARSGQFINGLLDGILKELKKQDRIRKAGRGSLEF